MTALRSRLARLRAAIAAAWKKIPAFYKDAGERVAWTFAQAAGGALLDDLSSGHITWRAIGYAGFLAIVKAYGAKKLGNPNTASLP